MTASRKLLKPQYVAFDVSIDSADQDACFRFAGGNFTYDSLQEDVVAAAHEAGWVCILAHPGRADLGPALTAKMLDQMLKATPLDGIEGHYRTYTGADTARYWRMAESRGLLIGAGSDSHGPGAPVDPRPWRAIWAKALLARVGFEVDEPPDGVSWAPGVDSQVARTPKRERKKEWQAVRV